ncbi:alpha-glucosidase [Peziza echinospora]|nr:alpha-glucosidase [Peziza echinospora]
MPPNNNKKNTTNNGEGQKTPAVTATQTSSSSGSQSRSHSSRARCCYRDDGAGAGVGAVGAVDIDKDCRGYTARNVRRSCAGLTADLVLIDGPCKGVGAGDDFGVLRLVVAYEDKSRLRVAITDFGNTRYQVPEAAFPRPRSTYSVEAEEEEELDPEDPPAPQCWGSYDLVYYMSPVGQPFSFTVQRKSTGETLFTTTHTTLVFQPQYIRLKTHLPQTSQIYGLGETQDEWNLHVPFPGDNVTATVRTMWARDAPGLGGGENLYSSHPLYFDHRVGGGKNDGTHGVFLLNSNGMDVKLYHNHTTNERGLEYNLIGGILDLYFLPGPAPVDVARQYSQVVGRPAMMPYWALGLHQCRYGYEDWYEVAEVVGNYSAAGIPLETMWTDIDYMYNRWVFTLDPERFPIDRMRQLVDHLHEKGQRYVMMVDPAVAHHTYPSFTRGVELDVFHYTNPETTNYTGLFKGVVWPGATVFPDWLHPKVGEWWTGEFLNFFGEDGVAVDGIWIDMNEPASFCEWPCEKPEELAKTLQLPPKRDPPREIPKRGVPGFPDTYDPEQRKRRSVAQIPLGSEYPRMSTTENPPPPAHHIPSEDLLTPPYSINHHDKHLSSHTLPVTILHRPSNLSHYDTHNLHGLLMSKHTSAALHTLHPTLRPFVLTRSSFPTAGTHSAKWLGDNLSTWSHYRSSISGMLHYTSLYQIPFVGSDVCGFIGLPSAELCARWAVLGALQPFYRNHNDINSPAQEFYLDAQVSEAAKAGIAIRFRILDYIYTALYEQSRDGTPAFSPMFFVFRGGKVERDIVHQYFIGRWILVSPILAQGKTSVEAYFPEEGGTIWYDFATGMKLAQGGGWVKLEGYGTSEIPVHIRGGAVLPLRILDTHEEGVEGMPMTTNELRERDFEVVVAPDRWGKAWGELYVDDGVSIVQKKDSVTELKFEYDGKGGLRIYGPNGHKVVVRRIVLLGIKAVVGALAEKNPLVRWEEERERLVVEGRWELAPDMVITLF